MSDDYDDDPDEERQANYTSFSCIDSSLHSEIDLPSNKNCFHRYFDLIRKGSLRGGIFSFIGATFNASCLIFPFIIHRIGIITASIVFFICLIVNFITLKMLMSVSLLFNKNSYRKCIQIQYGSIAIVSYDIINLITMLGLLMAYFCICYDILSDLLIDLNKVINIVIKSLVCCLQCFFCYIKNEAAITYLSLLGILLWLYSGGVIIYNMIVKEQFEGMKNERELQWYDYVAVYGIINSAFFNHNSLFLIAKKISNQTIRRTHKMVYVTYGYLLVFYLIIALCGYYAYPSCQDERFPILLFCKETNNWVLSAKCAIVISLHMFVPIKWVTIQDSCKYFKKRTWYTTLKIAVIIIMMVVFNICSYYLQKNVIPLLMISGGIFSIIISCLFPSIFYIKTMIIEDRNNNCKSTQYIIYILMMLVIVIGLGCSVIGIMELANVLTFHLQ